MKLSPVRFETDIIETPISWQKSKGDLKSKGDFALRRWLRFEFSTDKVTKISIHAVSKMQSGNEERIHITNIHESEMRVPNQIGKWQSVLALSVMRGISRQEITGDAAEALGWWVMLYLLFEYQKDHRWCKKYFPRFWKEVLRLYPELKKKKTPKKKKLQTKRKRPKKARKSIKRKK